MRDLEIRSLGAAVGKVTNAENFPLKKQVKNHSFIDLVKQRFSHEYTLAPAKTNTISDLDMSVHMKRELVAINSMQYGISTDCPLLNKGQEILVIGDDYIPDGSFRQKAFSEV